MSTIAEERRGGVWHLSRHQNMIVAERFPGGLPFLDLPYP
jgi:hypothetical protein